MSNHIYSITSIGRPLDPSFPTNRAVILILPLAGIIASAMAGVRGADLPDILIAGLVGIGVVLGAWAMGRELAPDDNAAAFISLVFAYVAYLVIGPPSLLLLFTALLLVRIVNRSTGLPARVGDSIAVTALALVTMLATRNPLLGLVGGLAFAFDARLPEPLRRQWLSAGLCLSGSLASLFMPGRGLDDMALLVPNMNDWPAALITLVYGIAYFRTRSVTSVGDVTGVRLSLLRLRAGMFIGFVVPFVALMTGQARPASALWAALAGVGLSSLAQRSGTSPQHA